MDNFVDERDYKLLENDKYTFFVLGRIMGGECDLLLTDHEKLIICFSSNPYPVWIWTPDGATEEEKEKAYDGESTTRRILFIKHPKWQGTQDTCPCFIRMPIMLHRMLVMRRSAMFSEENCVQ